MGGSLNKYEDLKEFPPEIQSVSNSVVCKKLKRQNSLRHFPDEGMSMFYDRNLAGQDWKSYLIEYLLSNESGKVWDKDDVRYIGMYKGYQYLMYAGESIIKNNDYTMLRRAAKRLRKNGSMFEQIGHEKNRQFYAPREYFVGISKGAALALINYKNTAPPKVEFDDTLITFKKQVVDIWKTPLLKEFIVQQGKRFSSKFFDQVINNANILYPKFNDEITEHFKKYPTKIRTDIKIPLEEDNELKHLSAKMRLIQKYFASTSYKAHINKKEIRVVDYEQLIYPSFGRKLCGLVFSIPPLIVNDMLRFQADFKNIYDLKAALFDFIQKYTLIEYENKLNTNLSHINIKFMFNDFPCEAQFQLTPNDASERERKRELIHLKLEELSKCNPQNMEIYLLILQAFQ